MNPFRWLIALGILFALMSNSDAYVTNNAWENEIVYHVFQRSYRDSNGDGHGDFKGLAEAIPEIKHLGCTAVMLLPTMKARNYHNYFADDWYDTDPKFGTLDEFKALVKNLHANGIKVIMDMETQYVADGHPWLKAALADKNAPETAYLAGGSLVGRRVTWYDGTKMSMATVNMNNDAVKAEFYKVFSFYAAMGVDGFRLDHYMDDMDWQGKQTHLYANLWTPLMNNLKKEFPGVFFVAEQADWDSWNEAIATFRKSPVDAIFGFRLRGAILTYKKKILEGYLMEPRLYGQDRTVFNFLENHDIMRFASLEEDKRKQHVAAAIQLLAKGVPCIYYGQELGMLGEKGGWGTDGNDIPNRLAYRWGKTLNSPGTTHWYAGSGPWAETGYEKDNDGISLEEQKGKKGSLYELYRKLIETRKSNPGILKGSQSIYKNDNPTVLGLLRKFEDHEALILFNLSEKATEISVPNTWKHDVWTGSDSHGKVKLAPYEWAVLTP